MQPAIEDLKEKGFTLFIVSLGSDGDISFLKPTGHRVLLDPGATAFKAYGITGIPHTFFVDHEGIIAETKLGWSEEASLDEFLKTVETLVEPAAGGSSG